MKAEDKKHSEKIEEYLNAQRVNGIKESTLKSTRYKLEGMNEFKDIISWKKEDVTKFILHMKKVGLNESYIEMNKALIKKFFRWMGKEDFIKDIKVKLPKRKFKSSDILTPDDINKMIESSNNNMEKALIALLFESGARINEVLSVKVKDIQETEKGMKILIPATKTGEDYRPCLCVSSGQYIRNHVLYPSLKPDDKLFNISDTTAWRIVKALGKKGGIDKPLSPHKLRHAQATYMVRKGYQESIIRNKMGWNDDSKMIARYVSIDGEDVINATYEKENGGSHVISPELIKPISIAEPIAIADNSIELNRLNNELESQKAELETKLAEQRAEIELEMEKKFAKMIATFQGLTFSPDIKNQATIVYPIKSQRKAGVN